MEWKKMSNPSQTVGSCTSAISLSARYSSTGILISLHHLALTFELSVASICQNNNMFLSNGNIFLRSQKAQHTSVALFCFSIFPRLMLTHTATMADKSKECFSLFSRGFFGKCVSQREIFIKQFSSRKIQKYAFSEAKFNLGLQTCRNQYLLIAVRIFCLVNS